MIDFNLVVSLLISITMLFFGILWRKRPPKSINPYWGYRSKSSMENQAAWDYAHQFIARIWLYTGIPLAIVSVVLLFVYKDVSNDIWDRTMSYLLSIEMMGMFLPIIATEFALKKKFDKNE